MSISGMRRDLRPLVRCRTRLLVEELAADEATAAADTLLLTVPNTLRVDYNAHAIESIVSYVARRSGALTASGPIVDPPGRVCRLQESTTTDAVRHDKTGGEDASFAYHHRRAAGRTSWRREAFHTSPHRSHRQ
jgi:hypothetical protein